MRGRTNRNLFPPTPASPGIKMFPFNVVHLISLRSIEPFTGELYTHAQEVPNKSMNGTFILDSLHVQTSTGKTYDDREREYDHVDTGVKCKKFCPHSFKPAMKTPCRRLRKQTV